MPPKQLNIITIPSDIGSLYAGKSKAPAAFRSADLHPKLQALGFQIHEFSAFSGASAPWESSPRGPNGGRNESNVVAACESVRETVKSSLQDQAVPGFQLILAGECLYCPPILSAYWDHLAPANKSVGIIYVDADADLYVAGEPSSSGNIAGMTMTHMTLREGALDSMKQFSRADGSGVVDASNIVLFGMNVDAPVNLRSHLGYLFDNSFHVVTAQAVQKAPVERAQAALKWMEDQVDYIVVHLDVDVIDPGEFPLCNVPNWTGLGFEETMAAVGTFVKSEKTVALSIAEVNPDHDPGLKMTERLVDRVVESLRHRAGEE